VTERARKTLASIVDMVNTFPSDNIEDESVTELIDKIRGKFKAAVSQLGMVPQTENSSFSF